MLFVGTVRFLESCRLVIRDDLASFSFRLPYMVKLKRSHVKIE